MPNGMKTGPRTCWQCYCFSMIFPLQLACFGAIGAFQRGIVNRQLASSKGGVHNIGVAKYVVYVARGDWGRIGGGGRPRTGMTEEGERTGAGG